MKTPRFHLYAVGARYGARDEFVGTVSVLLSTAYTRGWADHLADQYNTPWGNPEHYVEVVDARPEPVTAPVADDDSDLPF